LSHQTSASQPRTGTLTDLLAIWMLAVMFGYWLAFGSPGLQKLLEVLRLLGSFMQQFFSAPYQG